MVLNARRSYVAVTVTLTTAGQPYHIIDLVNAALALQAGAPVCPSAGREFNLYADSLNDATNPIFIGDAAVTSSNYGYKLSPGASRTYRSNMNNVLVGGKYAVSGANTQVLHVEVDVA